MWKRKNIAKILIVIGGFLSYLIADGCTFSVGIIYSEFLQVFHQSKASTAFLAGLIYALPQILGPIICPFVDVIGSSYGAIIGGTILAMGTFVSRFVTSLSLMYVTMGIFVSIGLELIYASAIISVTKGFSDGKYFGLACGITVSGSGIGVFLFNPLLNHLMETFTWKGALTIESAIYLHAILAGVTFKLASTFMVYTEKKIKQKTKVKIEFVPAQEANKHSSAIEIYDASQTVGLDCSNENNKENEENNLALKRKPFNFYGEKRSSAFLTMTQTKYCEPFYKPINYQLKSASLDRRINTGDGFLVALPVDERCASFVRRLSLYSNQNVKESHRASQETLSSKPSLLFENSETDVLDSKDSKSIDSHNITEPVCNLCNSTKSKFELFKSNLKLSILSLFSMDIWTNKRLLLFYLISFLFAMSVVVVWTFTYNHSLTLGIDETSASLLVSLIGAGSCFGQITFGFLSEYVSAISLYAIGCTVAGFMTIILRWVSKYWLLLFLHFVFGFGQGVSYALFSVILLHYNPVDLYPASLGIFLLVSGCGNLIGTSVSGSIYDMTGNYNVAYIANGLILMMCGLLAIPLVCLWHLEDLTT